MTRRKWIAVFILILWAGGLAILTRKVLFPDEETRRLQVALLVEPVSLYYQVELNGEHIGYASSQLDTSVLGVVVRRAITSQFPHGGSDSNRISSSFRAQLSQKLAMQDFSIVETTADGRRTVDARTLGDSLLEVRGQLRLNQEGGGFLFKESFSDTVPFHRGAVTSEIAPLLLGLGRDIRVGDLIQLDFFDAAERSTHREAVRIEAESLFVVVDSATFDSTQGLFVSARSDTARSWRVSLPGGAGGRVWFDKSGRVVLQEMPDGRVLRRTAFEISFENFRILRDAGQVVPPQPDTTLRPPAPGSPQYHDP